MAEIRAFRGFRYDLGRVGSLADVVAPPYDVIDSALQQRLYDASPYNVIRLELPQEQPGEDRHAQAARTLKDWIAGDVLKQDSARSIYVYEQEFTDEGQTQIRRGFLARVRLETFGTGRIYPHEQTLAGPKADRLSLYRATGFNISPVFGLYPDPAGEVLSALEPPLRRSPPLVATDHLGVINRFWVVTDGAAISTATGRMGPKPVFIADGHHRYETSLNYLAELQAAGSITDDDSPANFCLMMLVGMNDPGLVIQPTHRLVNGLGPLTSSALRTRLGPQFEIIGEFGPDAAACWEHVRLEDSQSVLGFGTAVDGRWFGARLIDGEAMRQLAPGHSPEWRGLAVSILHELVLSRLRSDGRPTCRYVHKLEEVIGAVESKECQLVVLVPPVGMKHVEAIAGNRETMPPKTTYFYPKLLTGLVLNSLKKD